MRAGVRGTTSFGVLFVTTVFDRPPAREGEIRFFGSERYQRSREPTTGTGAAYLRVTGRWAVFIYHLLETLGVPSNGQLGRKLTSRRATAVASSG